MGEWIDLDGGQRAWRATPTQAGPGILLLHAWWGLNATMTALADRLAEAGFMVIAPDLYDRIVVDNVADAEQEVDRVPTSQRQRSADAGLRRLLEEHRTGDGVGVIGFSMGAFHALEMAAQESVVQTVVLLYGTGRLLDWGGSAAAFQGHYAADDPYEPAEDVAEHAARIRAAGRPFELHTYPGTGHWFMEADRDAFEPAAAALAWQRTLEFLRRTLTPGGEGGAT